MAGRKIQIDWEAIERDYRIGQLSVREIARRHKVECSTITRRAKKESWVRDFTEEVKARTRAGLIESAQQAAQHRATESNSALFSGVDIAVETNLKVLREHQKGIRDNSERLDKLTSKFDQLIEGAVDLNELGKAAGSFESIVRTQKTLVGLERQALNIDDGSGNKKSIGELLDSMS
jgi:vacuolar-type H+-ATPase subunit D/Vma8